MANPYVREQSRLYDLDGRHIVIGVDYDTVTIGTRGGAAWRLNREQCKEFARAFTEACWEAADNARLMHEEAADV